MNSKTRLLSALFVGGLSIGVSSLRGYAQESKHDTLIVHFPFDRYDQTVGDEQKISAYLADAGLKKIDFDSIAVTGYTDQTGSVMYNRWLSRQRASFVLGYMNGLATPISGNGSGISKDRLRIDARGKADPVSVIDSLNRRVVVVFSYRVAGTDKLIKDTLNAKPVLDTIVTLANIFFVGNTPELTPSSRIALPSTISSLKKYMQRTIRILGNCNSPGPILKKDHPLYVLSVRRARAIYDYLISEGFDPQKLSYVGLGNTAMKNPHPYTREQMEENMRVDVEVYKQ